MKISLFTFLFIVGLFQSTNAQTSQLHFGARIGGSVSFLSGNFPVTDSTRTPGLGFYAAGVIALPMSSEWALQAEVQYVVEAGKFTGEFYVTDDNGTMLGKAVITSRHQVASLRVPLLVRWSSANYKAGSVGIVAGPVGGYIVSVVNYNEVNNTVASMPLSYEDDWTRGTERFQFGITAGAEYSITDRLTIDMRGMYSITNHLQAPSNASLSSLSVGAGYRF